MASRNFIIAGALAFSSIAQAGMPTRTVVMKGDPVPGIPETGTFTTFTSWFLNSEGAVAFGAFVSGPGINSSNSEGIWATSSSGSIDIVARQGWTAPDSLGRTFSQFLSPLMADSGQVSFTGIFPLGTSAGVYSSSNGNIRRVACDGVQAPDMPDGVLFHYPLSNNQNWISDPATNSLGQTAFFSYMSGPSVPLSVGLWAERAGTLSLVTRQGVSAPGTPSGVQFSSFGSLGWNGFWPAFNDLGQTAFLGGLTGTGVNALNDSGIWTETTGSLSLLAREGAAAPGTEAGVVFDIGSTSPLINNLGNVVFQSFLRGTGISTSNKYGIWLADPNGNVNLVARSGSPVPPSGGTMNWSGFGSESMLLGGSGAVVFSSSLSGSSVTASNNTAAWAFNEGEFHSILREGDPAPGLPAGVLIGDSPTPWAVNAEDQIIVGSYLTGSGVNSTNSFAVWARDTSGVLSLLVREGDLVEVRPGIFKTVDWIAMAGGSGGEDGHLQYLNDQGEYLYELGFTDNTRGLFVATIPEPATFALLIFGAGLIRRRRRTVNTLETEAASGRRRRGRGLVRRP